MPWTASCAAIVSAAAIAIAANRNHGLAPLAVVSAAALGALLFSLFIVGLRARRGSLTAAGLDVDGTVAWALAIQLGLVLLLVPAALLVTRSAGEEMRWTEPFLNKRWVVALYLLALGTLWVLPAAFEWWRTGASSGAPAIGSAAPDESAATGRRAKTVGLLVMVATAWFLAGPPWHLERHHREVESHEQAHLGPLQAIEKGYLPYIGPASTQYGPGSQLLLYAAMRRSGHFDMLSYRQAWATLHFASTIVVAIAAIRWLPLGPAVAVMVLAMVYSPLAFYGTDTDGTLAGFYGWANALRYLAPLVVVPSLVRAAGLDPRRPRRDWHVVALGVVWAAGSWIAQENLASTAGAVAVFLTLLCVTRTIAWTTAVRIARGLVLGFLLAIVPVVAYYARHGAAAEFVRNYLSTPAAVAAGYSNTWWPPNDTAARTYYATAPFLLALGVVTLWRLPQLKLHAPLDYRRTMFLAFLSIQAACFQVVLLRSDASHLQNTMLAMPFLLVLGARDLPDFLASPRLRPAVVRCAFVLVALAILPAGKLLLLRQIVVNPVVRLVGPAGPDPRVGDTRSGYARATAIVAGERSFFPGSSISMTAFLDFASDVHTIVGDRPTYIGEFSEIWTGPLYFFADLTPAPYPFDRETMMINDALQAQVVEHIRSHPAAYQCFIGASLDAPEGGAFLDVHPDAERLERRLGAGTVHILLARQAR